MNPQPATTVPHPKALEEIEITNWEPQTNYKTVRGFFSATLTSGMILHRLALWEKGNSRGIYVPSRSKNYGADNQEFIPLIEFTNQTKKDHFTKQVLKALDRFLAKEG